jgi:hypothetical protein
MSKSSIDHAELAGLKIALNNLKYPPKPDTQYIMSWMEDRIKELESK